ncbi:uncharacterized protein LMH87_008592 [Akanthomyces muscarius]|uniref:Gastric mucin-like protein n=1 Tax=Akanthomyces muscarius TaxID=2231603 RepID=A0A9W8UM40_AKAMU|nr:uncharacterized protein LMH87_008592 [Akanthomyces muscarius]KAJ4158045.1 hypothetical protein LMH87_008592 [Akanthomyces muscarius]
MVEMTSCRGAIVAIEGPKTVVSTQLRLLPANSQILILPALDTYIPTPASFLDVFDPVQYLRQINTAMKRRHRDAQTFLQRSSAEEGSRRLVFLEGGAASAHALCLKALMHHETAGDRGAAEAVLGRLIRHGLAGLAKAGQERHHSEPIYYAAGLGDEDESSDPSTRAMRAADALDRQTANLQVSNELDLTIRRSSSLPLYGYADTPSGDAAPFLVFGQSSLDDCTPTTERLAKSPFHETPRFSVVQYDQHGDMPPVFGFDDFPTARSFSTLEGGVNTSQSDSTVTAGTHRRLASDTISPMSDAFSMRSSLGKVEYGRASLLDMRTSVRGDGFMGVKAVGRSTATHKPKLSEPSIDETTPPEYNNTPARQFTENLASTPKNSSSTADTMPSTLTRVPSTMNRPRTILVKRTRPVIKLQPVPSGKKRRWQQGKSTYIDDDGDAPTSKPHESSDSEEYEPIFPRMEDLVLYLRSDLTPQPLLESALNAMREEYMRKSSCLSPSSSVSTVSTGSLKSLSQTDDDGTADLTTPETAGTEQDPEEQGTPKTAVKMAAEALPSMDDYDPFAYINPVYGAAQPSKVSEPTVTILRPPTPAQTPPPNEGVEADSQEVVAPEERPKQLEPDTEKEVIEELDSTIHEIDVEPKQPPIGVQNSIRAVLRQRYPVATAAPASGGYTPQFQFPQLLPSSRSKDDDDDDSLWRPIFRSRKTSSLPAGGGHQLKQILAIGLQSGVKREYAARVIGQIERFGTEPTGSARCTRLDFRYLLANTMQAFTARPLASQTAENPFTSPPLLATLMLPHLETYLAVHADIRFLILEYPPEHLATVVAIQKLAGVDLVKIAQLVDARSKPESLPFRHVREGSVSSGSVVSAASCSGSGGSSTSVYSKRSSSLSSRSTYGDLSKAKANFLLTSEASDKDIGDFVAAVWNLPVAQRPQSAPEGIPASSLPMREPQSLAPVSSPSDSSAEQKQKTPIKRKAKPAPLRVSALSAFPKTTGPQSPLSPSANILSVLAPPPPSSMTTPPTSSKPMTLRTITTDDFYTTSPSPAPRTPSPEAAAAAPAAGGQHGAMRVSAVGGSNSSGSNLTSATSTLRRQPSNSTMRTTNSTFSTASRATTTHIAYMRRMPPTPQSGRAFSPPSTSSLLPPVPRFLDTPSIAGSTLMHSPVGFGDDGASIMTFDPAEDSDYDQEEARLMPLFGKKQRRTKPGTQKALKVLGMMA